MPFTLEQLFVEIGLVGADELRDEITRVGGDVNKALGGLLKDTGATLTRRVTVPLTLAAGAMFNFAADAESAEQRFQTVFGDRSNVVAEWVSEIQSVIPGATADLKGMTASIQDLLVPLGVAPQAAEELTKESVLLAGALSRFAGVPIEQALGDLQSLLVGQTEPFLKYGVAVNVAATETEALRLGLIQEGDALTAAARAQANLSLAVQGTQAAQELFNSGLVDTKTELAFAQGELKELAVTFGNELLPAVRPAIQLLREVLQLFIGLPEPVRQGILVVGALAAALGPLLLVMGQLVVVLPVLKAGALALLGLGGPFWLGVAALTAVVAAGKAVVDNWEILKYEASVLGRAILDGLIGGLKAGAGFIRNEIVGFFRDTVIGGAKDALGISSPSKEFYEIGLDTFAGFEEGFLERSGEAIRGWADGLIQEVSFAVAEGSLEFGKFADSVIKDLKRIAIQAALTGIVNFVTGGIGGLVKGALGIGSNVASPFSGGSSFGAGSSLFEGGSIFSGRSVGGALTGARDIVGFGGDTVLNVQLVAAGTGEVIETITHRQRRDDALDRTVLVPLSSLGLAGG